MSRLGHSTLLKYLVDTPNMSESKTESTAIESEVPDKQELREGIIESIMDGTNNSKSEIKKPADEENAVTTKEDFAYSPVITVTKEESTFTKGDVKLQKVIVSEDISDRSSTTNKTLRVTATESPNEIHTEVHSEILSLTLDTESHKENNDTNNIEGENQKDPKKISKIPKLRLKQVVERIEKKRMMRNKDDTEPPPTQRARSSIPRLKDLKNPPEDVQKDLNQNKEQQAVVSPGVDDEFDKIYEQILGGENSNSLLSLEKISDPVKLESNFEEIIHRYDENQVQPISIEKVKSKIPLLKRKSEQEIDIPPPNVRRNSLNKSETDNKDDSKPKIPLGELKDKTFKSDVENIQRDNSSSTKTTETKSTNIKSETIVKKSYSSFNKTSVKSTTTQKSSETMELVNISSTGNSNKEIIENNKDSKRKIPVTTNSIDNIEFKINSASLNKQPLRRNIIDRISVQHNIADKEDKTKETEIVSSLSNTSSKVKSFTDISRDEKAMYTTSETVSYNKKVVSEQISSVSQDNYSHIEQDITAKSLRSPVFNMPTLPSNLTKLEKSVNIIKSKSFTPDNLPHSNEKTSSFIENKQYDVINPKTTTLFTHSLENDDTTQNTTTNKINENQYSSESIHQNKTVTYTSDFDYKNNIEQSSSNVTKKGFSSDEKITVDTSRKKNNTSDYEKSHGNTDDIIKSVNTGEQENNMKKTDIENSNFGYYNIQSVTGIKNVFAINDKSKEMKIEHKISQINNKSEVINFDLWTSSLTNNNNTIQESESNILRTTTLESKHAERTSKEQIHENNSIQQMNINESRDTSIKESSTCNQNISENNQTAFEKAVSVEESNQDLNRKTELYLSSQNTKITDTEEEDIIVLKGKVNRVIRRLDSKDYKVSKKEIDDVPKEVSVISKIAMFESESTNALPKNNELTSDSEQRDDKPKIVDEILKMIDKNNLDIDHNEHVSKSNPEKLVRQNLSNKEVSKALTNAEVSKPKINITETTTKQRNSSTINESYDVFMKKEDQKSSLEIWNEYRLRKQASDLQRARSLAELDLGDAVNGRVKQMVVRMISVERTNVGKKQLIDFKEKPRIGSVSQRIALFERKLVPIRGEDGNVSRKISTTTVTELSSVDDGELEKKIDELKNAKVKYGKLENMTYVELSDGRMMPALAVGTALLNPKLVQYVVRAAIDLGYRAFDTAYIYGNEQDVGIALQDKIKDGTVTREELFIISKLWSTFHRRDLAEKACKQSLEAMGLDYFDLYLIHNPMSFKEGPDPLPKIANVLQYSEHDYMDAWFGIESLVQKGLVKSAGVSNFNSVQLARLVEKGKIKPVVNQVECHPYLNQQRLEEFCHSRNIKLSCFGVLGSKGTPSDLTSGLSPVIDDPLVKVMAAGLGVTPAQLLISYQVQAGRGVVVKCSSAERLWDNGRALVAPLQASHAAALDALNRNKRIYTFKGMGDTHRNYPFKIPF